MIRLLIAADDLTGALDAGVQFAAQGIQTLVTTDADIDIGGIGDHIEVLAVDTETRHLSGEKAYETVLSLVKKAVRCGVRNIYKKTDSVLRGNTGSELLAVINGAESDKVMFIPAFPDNDRITHDSIQYVSGVPIAQSHFARDILNPVTSSFIPDIISQYTDIGTVTVRRGETPDFDIHRGIFIFNAETNEDMANIGDMLDRSGQLGLTAGCAGFAGVLCNVLNFTRRKQELAVSGDNTLVVSGSVNKTSIEQMDYLKENGIKGVSLTPGQKLNVSLYSGAGCDELIRLIKNALAQTGLAYIEAVEGESDIVEADRSMIAGNIGQIVKRVVCSFPVGNLFVIGGDTLLGIMRQLGINEIIPLSELSPGVVFSKVISDSYPFNLITKSGGFGQKKTVMSILSRIMDN